MSHDVFARGSVVAESSTLVHRLCVYPLTVGKVHSRRSDPVVGGAPSFPEFQRGAVTWREVGAPAGWRG